MSLASDIEERELRGQLSTREWHPVWNYGNMLRDGDSDELDGMFPSWPVGRFWSEGAFGYRNFRIDDGLERALIFPSEAPEARPILGELFMVCMEVRFGLDWTIGESEVGELKAIRLRGWSTPVWALIGSFSVHDEHHWRPCEHDDHCGMMFMPTDQDSLDG